MKHQNPVLVILTSLALYFPFFSTAQTQTLKGQVIDKNVRAELVGVTIQIAASSGVAQEMKGTYTNETGHFRFPNLPLGQYTVLVSYLGYENAVVKNVNVDAGKETDLLIELQEAVITQQEVVITARVDKEKPLNEFSTVSARTFSVEETRRFAAAVNDPGRMATSYAGVVSVSDGNNIIVVRGNAPNGLLWRMEGVDIPNPNHFSSVGTSGGGISILSSQLLTNSDFSTGAFAAEYGNALSGVFDLKLRKGNNDKREFTIQAGLLGLDLAAEGPFRSGKNAGSYLVNYRYSTLSLISKLGVNIGDAVTNFQDLSFNIWAPAGKLGSFSLFGMGGLSKQTLPGVADSLAWHEDFQNRYPSIFTANTGVVGLTHNKTWSARTHLKSALVVSGTENATDFNQLLLPDYTRRKEFETVSKQTKTTLSTVLSHKFNAKHYIRTGAYVNFLNFDFIQGSYQLPEEQFRQELDQTGHTQTFDGFFQWQYRPSRRVTFNLGAHALAMLLNNQVSLEPRASLRYAHNPKHAFSIGYGLHGQIPTLGVYFVKDAEGQLLNPDLDIQKSHHLVFSYDYSPVKNLRLKSELYYQHLFNIGIERDKSSSFSMLNEIEGIAFRELTNRGLGRNYGLEFTAEQFLTRGLYFLASVSLYRSEYQGSDQVWRSSRFDGKFATSFTAGKEWDWSRKGKNRSFGVNIKLLGTGGQKATPIDLTASIAQGETVYIDDKAFTNQQPAYFRLDTGFRLKRNYKRLTTTVSLDIQNTTNRANYGGEFYNPFTQKVESWSQGPLIPVLAYRLEF